MPKGNRFCRFLEGGLGSDPDPLFIRLKVGAKTRLQDNKQMAAFPTFSIINGKLLHLSSFIISREYNQFFKKQLMHFSDCQQAFDNEEGCFFTPYLRVQQFFEELELPLPFDLPSLPKEDSMIYITQFLEIIDWQLPFPAKANHDHAAAEESPSNDRIFGKEQNDVCAKGKKIKKLELSPFHNYQKHLNNALKKIVIVPCFEEKEELYKKAAREIWEIYLSTEIKTKKILHAVFNQRNQYSLSQAELRTYGLWEIYTQYGERTFNRAKIYLSKLAIDQIDGQNIDGYLKTRKMRKVEGFKEYILQFRQELCNGYLKRRFTAEGVN